MKIRGVHRFVTDPAAAAETMRRSGYRVARIGPQSDIRDAVVAIGRGLNFPGYFGRNLDALWDCLGELDAPTAVVWRGWQHHPRAEPERWAALMRIIADRAAADPPFVLVLV